MISEQLATGRASHPPYDSTRYRQTQDAEHCGAAAALVRHVVDETTAVPLDLILAE
jgi:hypothetical protein